MAAILVPWQNLQFRQSGGFTPYAWGPETDPYDETQMFTPLEGTATVNSYYAEIRFTHEDGSVQKAYMPLVEGFDYWPAPELLGNVVEDAFNRLMDSGWVQINNETVNVGRVPVSAILSVDIKSVQKVYDITEATP